MSDPVRIYLTGLHHMKNLITARVLLADLVLCGALIAQSTAPALTDPNKPSPPPAPPKSQSATPTAKPASNVLPQRYRQNRVAASARQYYAVMWGVDSLAVKSAESGEIIRFSYRVLDAEKAKVLNDKKSEPSLIDPRSGVKLVVPSLEKVGKLRQSATPEAGKMYWMAFSNKGGFVKPGHRVDVVIGQFKAEGLVVQ
jgi:hypothetical protein